MNSRCPVLYYFVTSKYTLSCIVCMRVFLCLCPCICFREMSLGEGPRGTGPLFWLGSVVICAKSREIWGGVLYTVGSWTEENAWMCANDFLTTFFSSLETFHPKMSTCPPHFETLPTPSSDARAESPRQIPLRDSYTRRTGAVLSWSRVSVAPRFQLRPQFFVDDLSLIRLFVS